MNNKDLLQRASAEELHSFLKRVMTHEYEKTCFDCPFRPWGISANCDECITKWLEKELL